jgi:hypothetical protein
MQAVRRSVMVGKKQEADADLRDEQRLREGEQVRYESARLAPAVIRKPCEHCCAPGRSEHEECDGAVCRQHRRRTLQGGFNVIEEGKPAPDFELTTEGGDTVSLSSLRGKPVVLYFYPKDDTPGS